jgi:DNA-binding transcriptional LysR family regulator
VAVADFGSFGEAALQLGLTQPTVSHAIATLEDELGVVLLSRGRNGAQLTPAGEAITQQAREVLQLLEQMHQTANLHKGLQGGQVRIATFRGAIA